MASRIDEFVGGPGCPTICEGAAHYSTDVRRQLSAWHRRAIEASFRLITLNEVEHRKGRLCGFIAVAQTGEGQYPAGVKHRAPLAIFISTSSSCQVSVRSAEDGSSQVWTETSIG